MFVDLENFYKNYRIKNTEVPNEVTLNRGIMRLKREIRELKSMIDIITKKSLEPWNSSKYYEADEYVSWNGNNYRSRVNGNHGLEPGISSDWELVTLETIGNTDSEIDDLSEYSEVIQNFDDVEDVGDEIGTYTVITEE